MDLTTDSEFQDLLGRLSDSELAALEASLLQYGCFTDLIVWNGTLLDGYNRYEICRKHGIPFNVKSLEFGDRREAFNWIIDNQLARRNLTPARAWYLEGKKYLLEKRPEGRPEKLPQSEGVSPGETAERLAKQRGVSRATVERNAAFAEAMDKLPEPAKRDILSGRSRPTRLEVIKVGDIEDDGERAKAAEELVGRLGRCRARRESKAASGKRKTAEEKDQEAAAEIAALAAKGIMSSNCGMNYCPASHGIQKQP